jgi:hypothetical protein
MPATNSPMTANAAKLKLAFLLMDRIPMQEPDLSRI